LREKYTLLPGSLENQLFKMSIKNSGPGTLPPFKVHLLTDKMDLLSLSPEPVQMRVSGYPEFSPLPAGQSINIKATFVATSPGVVDGGVYVDGYEEGIGMKTVIR
jgi:hypothetical protein